GGGGGGGAGGGINPLSGGGSTIAKDNSAIANALNASGSPAQGSWFYNPLDDSWSFELTGNFAIVTSGNRTAANGYYLVSNSVGSSAWYKFDAAGKMLKGWQVEQTGVYYLNEDPTSSTFGAMLSGWIMIDGIYYYFGNDGRLVVNGTTPDGYIVDANGARIGLATNVSALTGTMGGSLEEATPLINTINFLQYIQAVRIQYLQQQQLQQLQQQQQQATVQ
ncbi:MAG: hypothetical protein IKP66_07080, partial [Lachnospiraceae bacterium]|nr:hypothetical protein [Lachnospiraceae bacterium]